MVYGRYRGNGKWEKRCPTTNDFIRILDFLTFSCMDSSPYSQQRMDVQFQHKKDKGPLHYIGYRPRYHQNQSIKATVPHTHPLHALTNLQPPLSCLRKRHLSEDGWAFSVQLTFIYLLHRGRTLCLLKDVCRSSCFPHRFSNRYGKLLESDSDWIRSMGRWTAPLEIKGTGSPQGGQTFWCCEFRSWEDFLSTSSISQVHKSSPIPRHSILTTNISLLWHSYSRHVSERVTDKEHDSFLQTRVVEVELRCVGTFSIQTTTVPKNTLHDPPAFLFELHVFIKI